MTRLWTQPIRIRVQYDELWQPLRFTWHNRGYRIEQIQEHWQIDTDWWHEQGQIQRDYWSVTTHEGLLCVLYFDRLDGNWYLSKVYD